MSWGAGVLPTEMRQGILLKGSPDICYLFSAPPRWLVPNPGVTVGGDDDASSFFAAGPAELGNFSSQNAVSPFDHWSDADAAWRDLNANLVRASTIIN